MNLLNFTTLFPDEASCKAKWKEYRDKQGVVCPRCGSIKHYWKKDKENYECKHCGYRQSLKANTVMHGSQLPYRYWFVAIHLLTLTKKSFSASELQRQLGHSTYNPIWAMLHKLRQVMGMRDARYQLSQVVELDEGFFSTEMDEEEKDKPLKRGRGSQKKSKVLVMAESISVEGGSMNKNGKPRKVGHIKMFVIEDLKSSTIDGKVVENIDSQSIIDSDSSASYTHVAIFLVSNEFQGYCLMLPEMKADKISEIYYQAMAKRFNVNYYNSTLTDHKNNKFETSKTSNDKANNHNFFPVSFQISSI